MYDSTMESTVTTAAVYIYLILSLIITAAIIVGIWKMFEKAGEGGWKSLIPFYNMYVLTEICGMTGWLFLLCFIPGIGTLIWTILIAIKLAPAFGKETAFAIGLILLPLIFELILAFGDAQYQLGGGTAKATAGSAKKTSTSTKKKTKDPWVEGK